MLRGKKLKTKTSTLFITVFLIVNMGAVFNGFAFSMETKWIVKQNQFSFGADEDGYTAVRAGSVGLPAQGPGYVRLLPSQSMRWTCAV